MGSILAEKLNFLQGKDDKLVYDKILMFHVEMQGRCMLF